MNKTSLTLTGLAALMALAGCATAPTGPSIMALPGAGKSFEQFNTDDVICRQYANSRIDPNATNNNGVRDALVGTAIGAVAGTVIGGNHQGTGVGAGVGLLAGSMAGAGDTQRGNYGSQRQYDNAYTQCMYAKGNQVPVNGRNLQTQPRQPQETAPSMPPPPPPGWRGE